MMKIMSFVFIMAISLIAVIIAVISVLVLARSKISKAKKNGTPSQSNSGDDLMITCKYCGSKNREIEVKCGNCGASL